jgi:hypothetical protein
MDAYHYPADLMSLLIEAIPRLCKSKQDVLTFFRGCGVPLDLLADQVEALYRDQSSVRKAHQVRTVLIRLNEGGDRLLRPRREVIKRVTETEDFSACWPEDRLEAQGLVAQVRSRVDKADAFARMNLEREAEAAKVRRGREATGAAAASRQRQLAELRDQFGALFMERDPHRRGKSLEGVLNRYFQLEGLSVREAFVFREAGERGPLEQIDGVIELDGDLYLVEMKWWDAELAPGDVAQHMVRVGHRAGMRGLTISASGYTEAAIVMCRDELQRCVFVLAELRELVMWLERQDPVAEMLRQKVRAATIDKRPLLLLA